MAVSLPTIKTKKIVKLFIYIFTRLEHVLQLPVHTNKSNFLHLEYIQFLVMYKVNNQTDKH